ncbi:PAS domain-containing protein [Roseiflexus castenholzii]|uniref:Putative PAS/PAC sensor protein n=1 Tax=Roseiflexus castenholzii (strain DSM 13941 / HLO8) TaxID=383372 RepID=A7NFN8_ROSCS|nr:PAS domain-containing protein [Roseiflexus castenholzii]ABU56264.1 putative PAS/PAC sensor protein [Roseiflexus castenholzii DSM 13941]
MSGDSTSSDTDFVHRIARLEADLEAAHRRIAELERVVERGYGMVDAIPAMVYFKDREHRYQYGNRAFTERIRVSAEEMAGKTDYDLFPPEVAAAYLADDERVMATGEPSLGIELPVSRPDGTIGWVSNSAVPYRDRSGAVVGMVGIAIDITRRKQIEEALRRNQEVQRALLDTIPAMVYLKDRQHRYLLGNRVFADAAGISVDEVEGKTDHDLFLPEEAEAYIADDEQVMATGEPHLGIEEKITEANGRVTWLMVYKAPFRDEQGRVTGMVGIAFDVTARKEMEEALRRSQAEQQALIEQQAQLLATIRQLSTPVLPVTQDALVLPLIGDIDTARSQQIVETLLNSVQRYRAKWAIIDITGVPLVDTAVANHLIQATQGVALLGARTILVGVSPELAQTIVGLGVDLKGLISQSDLRSAIAFVLKRSQQRSFV